MIKVLHCVSKMDRAGQETFIMNVYRNINREKIQFNFLCTDSGEGEYDDEIRELGGQIFHLSKNSCSKGLKRYYGKIKILATWLKDNSDKYDIIHVHTYHALDVFVHLEAARKAKSSKIIIHSHNTNGPHKALHCLFRKINSLYSYTKLACAEDAGKWLYGERYVNNGEVTVVYNGIKTSDFRFNQGSRKEILSDLHIENKKIIGHIGRFNYQKNHEFIIAVFKEYLKKESNAILLLVGKGENFEKIQKLVFDEGIDESVLFLGVRDDVEKLLSAMDVLLFPSLFEGLSVVLVEAQAAGLPCVVSTGIVPIEEKIIPELLSEMSLNEPIQKWVNELDSVISNRVNGRIEFNYLIEKSHFNIINTALKMEEIYLK